MDEEKADGSTVQQGLLHMNWTITRSRKMSWIDNTLYLFINTFTVYVIFCLGIALHGIDLP
jgi:hypothetical protein